VSGTPKDAPGANGARIAQNPFYVLELPSECAAVQVERQGNKLLAMLELGFVEAETYDSPLGTYPRTAEAVRRAMAELQDPERRLVHELWAAMDPTVSMDPDSDDPTPETNGAAPAGGWPEAMDVFGWRRR